MIQKDYYTRISISIWSSWLMFARHISHSLPRSCCVNMAAVHGKSKHSSGKPEHISKTHITHHSEKPFSKNRMSKRPKTFPGDDDKAVADENSKSNTTVSSDLTIEQAILRQANPPRVDVGPLSPKRKVPHYQRHRDRSKSSGSSRSYWTDHGQHENWNQNREPRHHKHKRHEEVDAERRYYPRQWELTEFGRYYESRPSHHRGFEFTVMSYNVLAQDLLENHMELYEGCRRSHLDWSNRWRLIFKELKYLGPDIICLQEVNCDHYKQYFQPHLEPLGYEGQFKSRTGDKTDGCATFYKVSKFVMEKCVPVKYYNVYGGNVLDRDNVALIVELRPKTSSVPSSRRLCVANTHLLYTPRRGDVKLAQLMVLFAELDKHGFVERDNKHSEMIVCGDFNSVPFSPLYQLVVGGHLRYEGYPQAAISGQEYESIARRSKPIVANFLPSKVGITDHCQYTEIESGRLQSRDDVTVTSTQGSGRLEHNLKLVSAYDHFVGRVGHYCKEATTCHTDPCTVDYIFYSVHSAHVDYSNWKMRVDSVEEAQLQLVGRFGLLSKREFDQQGGIPNHRFGSDHLSIMAKFALR